jgi:hypothetical protein
MPSCLLSSISSAPFFLAHGKDVVIGRRTAAQFGGNIDIASVSCGLEDA